MAKALSEVVHQNLQATYITMRSKHMYV